MKKKSSLFYKPPAPKAPKPKRKWFILPYLWRAVKYTCTAIGASIILSLVIGLVFSSMLMKQANIQTELPSEMILFYKLDGEIPEGPSQSGFDAFGPQKLKLQDLIAALESAKTDPRVKAFVMSVRSSQLAISQVQELREAVIAFKEESNKPAYIFSLSYGEAGQGLALYSLAAAFDEIWMAPLGTLSINGLRLEQPYARALLARIGIEPQFLQREEYKGVFEMFTNERMSDATRESLQSLSESLVKEFIKDILSSRVNTAKGQNLAGLINAGFFIDTEAEKLGLVDRVEYGDILVAELRQKLGGSVKNKTPELVKASTYRHHINLKAPPPKPNDIAVIYVQGPIMVLSEEESGNSILGNTPNGANEIASLIVQAAEDKRVKSIVLRVDSPGGSPTASELIRRAVVRAQEMNKPVIVSMGSMAASGGYWVSAPADYIFALPGTITGSIGVAGGKVSLKEFWSNVDVNWDHVGIGRNAGMYSMNEPFSTSERERISASMDRTYDMFLDIVATGRNMTPELARSVAKGRVWTGAQAIDKGLVDELGSLNDALDYAAVQVGYNSRKDMNIITLPKPKTPLEEILELLQQTSSLPLFMQQQNALWQKIGLNDNRVLQDLEVMENGRGVIVYDPLGGELR